MKNTSQLSVTIKWLFSSLLAVVPKSREESTPHRIPRATEILALNDVYVKALYFKSAAYLPYEYCPRFSYCKWSDRNVFQPGTAKIILFTCRTNQFKLSCARQTAMSCFKAIIRLRWLAFTLAGTPKCDWLNNWAIDVRCHGAMATLPGGPRKEDTLFWSQL